MERKTNNPLLVKAELGRAKQLTTKLPPAEFVYGVPMEHGDDLDKELKRLKMQKMKEQLKPTGQQSRGRNGSVGGGQFDQADFLKINKFNACQKEKESYKVSCRFISSELYYVCRFSEKKTHLSLKIEGPVIIAFSRPWFAKICCQRQRAEAQATLVAFLEILASLRRP